MVVWILIGLASVLAIGLVGISAVRCGRDEDRLRERLGDGADLVFSRQQTAAVENRRAAAEVLSRDFPSEECVDDGYSTFI